MEATNLSTTAVLRSLNGPDPTVMLVAKSELAFCSHARQLTNAGFAEVFGLTGGHREWLGGGAADFATSIIIPVRPSPNDLRAVGRTVEIVRAAKKPFLFVLNQINSTARITLQASGALSKHGPVAETAVASRVGFAVSMTDGRTAAELEPNSKSAAEIADLWREIAGLLTEGKGA